MRVNEDFGSGTKTWKPGGRWYVRVLPRRFDPAALDDGAHGPFVAGYGGFSWGHTAGGVLTYSGSVRSETGPELDAASMWFRRTGEIWVAQTGIAGEWQGRPCFHGDHVGEKWADLVGGSLGCLARHGASGPYAIRLGVTGLDGLYWPDGHRFGGEPPAALESAVEHEFQAGGAEVDDWRAGVAEAWAVMRRAFGLPPATDEVIEAAIRKACR